MRVSEEGLHHVLDLSICHQLLSQTERNSLLCRSLAEARDEYGKQKPTIYCVCAHTDTRAHVYACKANQKEGIQFTKHTSVFVLTDTRAHPPRG